MGEAKGHVGLGIWASQADLWWQGGVGIWSDGDVPIGHDSKGEISDRSPVDPLPDESNG